MREISRKAKGPGSGVCMRCEMGRSRFCDTRKANDSGILFKKNHAKLVTKVNASIEWKKK